MLTTCPRCHRPWTDCPDAIRLPGRSERYICADCALSLRPGVIRRLSERDRRTVLARGLNPIITRGNRLGMTPRKFRRA